MAKREKRDIGLNNMLDEIERRIFVLKMNYEKYFSGLERIEPVRERDEIKRMIRDLQNETIINTQQRYRFTQVRARYSSMELYWQRNLVMLERGTHPKMKFRMQVRERQQRELELRRIERAERLAERGLRAQQQATRTTENQSEDGMRSVYDQLVTARRSCGQESNLSYEELRSTLNRQAQALKERYNCDRVQFRVTVENGKAKMKATPINPKS